jgi:peptidoglycan/xylan/chitin deacetylase (PgdA/CDA1 family)
MNKILVWGLTALGKAIYHLRLYPLVMWWNRASVKVLLYHACEPEESDYIKGLRSNTMPAVFGAHLDFLQRFYRLVSLADLERGGVPSRAVTITFDDGYRSVYTDAYPHLRARSIPATVYLVTSVLDTGQLVWVNQLNWLLLRLPEVSRPLATAALNLDANASVPTILDRARVCYDKETIDRLVTAIREAAPSGSGQDDGERLYVTWAEVAEMSNHDVTFGSHTVFHPSLPRLRPEEMHSEMTVAQQTIAARLGSCQSFAYPFGDVDDDVRQVAQDCGFDSIMEVGGVNRCLDAARIARIPVSATTDAALFAELEVVTPVKAFLKGIV